MSTSKDFAKIIDKQKADLAKLKAMFDEQSVILEEIKQAYTAMGIEKHAKYPIEKLPQEYQAQYLAFERDLQELNELLSPIIAKPAKAPGKKMRNMI